MCLFLTQIACSRSPIIHGLDEIEANEILVVLEKNGISGEKIQEEGRTPTYMVQVPEGDAIDARNVLNQNNLPRKKEMSFKEVYGGEGGMIPTQTQEKAKYIMALQGEIALTFKAIPNILEARVHISVPKENPLLELEEKQPEPKASVWFLYTAVDKEKNPPISKENAAKIIANAVEGLKPENVFVSPQLYIGDTEEQETSAEYDNGVETVKILGFEMVRSAKNKFRIAIGVVAGLFLLIAVLIFTMYSKNTAMKTQLMQLQHDNHAGVPSEK